MLNHDHRAGITFEAFAKFMGADWAAEPAAATQRPTDRKVHRKGGGTVPDRRRAGCDSLLAAHAAQAAQAKLGGAHPGVRALCGAASRGSGSEIGGVGAGAEAPPLTPTHTDDIESPTHLERLEEVVVLGEISAALGSDAHGAGDLEA